jgi:hypothetical protein
MKIDTDDNKIVLKEVYSGLLMETAEGNQIGVCMRDDTFEISVIPKGKEKPVWFRIDMQNVEINNLGE